MATENLLPPPPDTMIISFMTLRKIVGFLGLFLVPVMIGGSCLLDHTRYIQISVSAYYYTHMRDPLTGIICGISLFLLSYHGYSKTDSVFSKLSGLFALGIAFFPTSEQSAKTDVISKLHYLTSAGFFIGLSYMSIFLFTKTSGDMTPQKRQRNKVYRVCGIIMLCAVTGIPVDGIAAVHAKISFLHPTLILETIALSSFGISWLTKGEFLLKDR